MPRLSEDERLRINLDGRALERAGRLEDAAALYETGGAARTDTPATYQRLAIVYRTRNRPDDECRVLMPNYPERGGQEGEGEEMIAKLLMAAGVTDRPWNIEDLVSRLEN